jgi:hypothetical protein
MSLLEFLADPEFLEGLVGLPVLEVLVGQRNPEAQLDPVILADLEALPDRWRHHYPALPVSPEVQQGP